MNTNKANFEQTIDNYLLEIFSNYNFHKIGIIQSVNFTKGTAKVKIVNKYQKQSTIYEYPLIEAPIRLNANKNGGFLFPIAQGCYCSIHFNDVSIDDWFRNGGIDLPKSKRIHSLNDGIIDIGLFPFNQGIDNYNNDSVKMFFNQSIIELKDKISIKNNSSDIKTLLTTFIDTLKTIQTLDPVTGPAPLTPISVANLENLKTLINNLFV
jgi:hypothetical protein